VEKPGRKIHMYMSNCISNIEMQMARPLLIPHIAALSVPTPLKAQYRVSNKDCDVGIPQLNDR